ncbi:VanW family protein [Streptomyces sp. NPDC091268]|uniref:VanW family protein n=1 Tax=Streptomyces sp. NPDC091268 TaxID=3365979 RepID=UPI00380F0AEF
MRSPHSTRTVWRAAFAALAMALALCLGHLGGAPAHAAPGDGAAEAAAAAPAAPRPIPEAARRLGIKDTMSSFTVDFPVAPYRTTNVAETVKRIDGSVVMPGRTWSFNRTVGERTPENGFVDGIMINDGRYVKSPGGGVSAVATTLYNALFFAGVKPLEHGAHSFYIERYPEGREATVAWGTLDLRWLNDSGHPIYIQARSTDHSVTITFLGTKRFDSVRAVKGPRTHITPPAAREATGPDCEAQTPYEGFDVAVDRVLVRHGREVRRDTFKTHYTPRDSVTCVPAKESASPTPGTTATPPAPANTPATTPAPSPTTPGT